MFEAVYQFIERLFKEFSWTRLLFLVSVLLVVFLAVWAFESYTDMLQLGRIERAARLLEELAEMETMDGISGNSTLQRIHSELADNLQSILVSGQAQTTISPLLLKILTAVAPWFITLVIYAGSSARGERGIGITTLTFMMLAMPFVLIGAVIPLFHQVWINYAVYPLGSYLLFFAAVVLYQRRKKRHAAG